MRYLATLMAFFLCILLGLSDIACGAKETSSHSKSANSPLAPSPSPAKIGEPRKKLRDTLSEQQRRLSRLADSFRNPSLSRKGCLPWFKAFGRRKGSHQDTSADATSKGKQSIEPFKETSKFTPIYHGVIPGTVITLLRRMSEAILVELTAKRTIHNAREEFWETYGQWIRMGPFPNVEWSQDVNKKWARFHQVLEAGNREIMAARKRHEQAFESLQNLKMASREMNKSVSRVFQTKECRQMLESMRADKVAMKDLTGCEID